MKNLVIKSAIVAGISQFGMTAVADTPWDALNLTEIQYKTMAIVDPGQLSLLEAVHFGVEKTGSDYGAVILDSKIDTSYAKGRSETHQRLLEKRAADKAYKVVLELKNTSTAFISRTIDMKVILAEIKAGVFPKLDRYKHLPEFQEIENIFSDMIEVYGTICIEGDIWNQNIPADGYLSMAGAKLLSTTSAKYIDALGTYSILYNKYMSVMDAFELSNPEVYERFVQDLPRVGPKPLIGGLAEGFQYMARPNMLAKEILTQLRKAEASPYKDINPFKELDAHTKHNNEKIKTWETSVESVGLLKNGDFDHQYDLDSFIEDLEAEMTNLETTTKVDIDADRLAAQMQFNTHLKILNYMAQHRSHNIALKDNAEADVQSRAINFVNGSLELRNSTLKERVSA